MSYFKDTIKGLSWMTGFRVAYRLIGIVRIGIIAHILSPYSLGIFGIATISLGFLEIITETGINIFLIQEKENIDDYIDSAWVVSIFRGIIISIIIVATAGIVSTFFKSPDSKYLLYVAALVPLIRGFINPAVVKFQKNLLFNKEFFYRVSMYFAEAIFSIAGALILRNPLGLIFGLVGGAIYELIYTFIVAKPLPRFVINFTRVKRVIRRGIWVTFFGIFEYIYTQSDNIIVGRMLGISSLGIYQNAYKISTTPLTEVGDIFFRVTFPIFSKISGERERLKRAFVKTTIVNATLMVLAGIFVYIFASPIVKIIFGQGWEAAIPVVRLLAVFGVTRGIAVSPNTFLVAKSKQKYSAIVAFVSAAGLLITIMPLIRSYGIIGAGLAAIIGTLISLPLTIYFVNKTFTE